MSWIKTISKIGKNAVLFIRSFREKSRNGEPVRISSAGEILNADGVSQSPYLGPIYGDDLGRGRFGASYASEENASPFA